MVLLIGNYAPDRQQSMQRFNAMMLEGLRDAGVPVELIRPPAILGRIRFFGGTVWKWLGYIDKYLLFCGPLRRKLAKHPGVVHICDHSNATYARAAQHLPLVITCHDLLAVRGGLGEDTDCPASFTGRILQRWILRGLGRANVVACVSRATAEDAERLINKRNGKPIVTRVELGLNYPYRRLSPEVAHQRLLRFREIKREGRFVLHVGSNLRRKNREGLLRIMSKCAEALDAQIVFAGDFLSDALRQQAHNLGLADRTVEVGPATDQLLEALYSRAFALLYPSRFEGFGWPIIEAQACACPVVCSSAGPMSDIAGAGALFREPGDEEGFANDLQRLADSVEHSKWSGRALENARRFSAAHMIEEYRKIYRSLTLAC